MEVDDSRESPGQHSLEELNKQAELSIVKDHILRESQLTLFNNNKIHGREDCDIEEPTAHGCSGCYCLLSAVRDLEIATFETISPVWMNNTCKIVRMADLKSLEHVLLPDRTNQISRDISFLALDCLANKDSTVRDGKTTIITSRIFENKDQWDDKKFTKNMWDTFRDEVPNPLIFYNHVVLFPIFFPTSACLIVLDNSEIEKGSSDIGPVYCFTFSGTKLMRSVPMVYKFIKAYAEMCGLDCVKQNYTQFLKKVTTFRLNHTSLYEDPLIILEVMKQVLKTRNEEDGSYARMFSAKFEKLTGRQTTAMAKANREELLTSVKELIRGSTSLTNVGRYLLDVHEFIEQKAKIKRQEFALRAQEAAIVLD